MRPVLLLLSLALAVAVGPRVAESQTPPSRQEIEKRIKEELDRLEDATSELEGTVKLTYKPIPTDPVDLVKNSGQLPPGANADAMAKQYAPMARPYIEKYAGTLGKLKVEKEFKFKTTKVSPGEYTFGLIMDEFVPIAVAISGAPLKTAIQVPIRPGKPPTEPFSALKVEVRPGKKPDEFVFVVGFARLEGEAGKFSVKK